MAWFGKSKEQEKLTFQAFIDILGANNQDVVIREINVSGDPRFKAHICFVDGLVNYQALSESVLKPFQQEMVFDEIKDPHELLTTMLEGAVYHTFAKRRSTMDDILTDVLGGSMALFLEKVTDEVLTFEARSFPTRSVEQPSDENVLKGSKSGFVESIRSNTVQIRRKIQSPNLRLEAGKIGQRTHTSLVICYIEGLTNPKLVQTVRERLAAIDVDGVLTTAVIEENIVEHKYLPFPQVMITERPDNFCGKLLDGQVGVIIDELPTAFIVPGTMTQFIRAPEDYANNFWIASMIILLRYLAIFVTLLFPAFYIALTTFHQEMIPTELAISIMKSKMGVPFPSFAEVILMLLAFDMLMEAGLRLPQNMGQTVSIVGALIVGQAAVDAQIVSPAMVIVIATTAITSFVIPNQDFTNALRLWRFIFVVLASLGGLMLLFFGVLVLFYILCTVESFGVPYLSPYVAANSEEIIPDTMIRLPIWMQKFRPRAFNAQDKRKQK